EDGRLVEPHGWEIVGAHLGFYAPDQPHQGPKSQQHPGSHTWQYGGRAGQCHGKRAFSLFLRHTATMPRAGRWGGLLVAATALASASCGRGLGGGDQLPTFPVVVRVDSDPGVPLPGASVIRKEVAIGQTGPDGKLAVT